MRFEFHGCFNVMLCHVHYTDAFLSAVKSRSLTWSIGETEKRTNYSFSLWEEGRWTRTLGYVLCWYQS
jgi:hypothetical protein